MRRATAPIRTACLLLAAAPVVLRAQQLRGRVVDGVAARPIAGVVVSTFDSAGHPLARTLSDETGAFRLLAPAAVRLRLQRLGFRPRDLRFGAPLARDTVLVDLALQPVPLVIGALRVRESQLCKPRADDAEALALWEQARSGLLASVVAQEARPAKMRLLVYDRTRDPSSDSIETQTTQLVSASGTRAFYAADSARGFDRKGYMVSEGADRRRFFAPDADVLLDPAFAANHCFSVVPGQGDHHDEVGLGFQPAASRKVDVEGTLWLDLRTPALRALEFSYTGVDALARSARSGGRLRFATLPDGVVFIDAWRIRVGRSGYQGADRFPRVLDIQEHGGMVVTAAWPESTSWASRLPVVAGDVTIKGAHAPARDIKVWLDGADAASTTDGSGQFALDDVLPGPYQLFAIDGDLAPFDLEEPIKRRIVVGDSTSAAIHIDVPSRSDIAADLCDAERMPDSVATVLLRVVDSAGANAKAADVLAEWTAAGVQQQSASVSTRGASADSEGRAVLCALPRGRQLRLRARGAHGFLADTSLLVSDTTALATLALQLRRAASPAIAHAADEAFASVPHAGGRWSAHAGSGSVELDLEQDGPDVSGTLVVGSDARPGEERSVQVTGTLRGDTLLLSDGQYTVVDGVVARNQLKATVASGVWRADNPMHQVPSGHRLAFTDGPTVQFWRVERR